MTEASFITELIANIGAVGVIFWLVYYVFKTLLPKRDADFTAALEKRDALFTEALDKVQEDNHRENDRVVGAVSSLEQRIAELATQVEKQTRLLIAHDSATRGKPIGAGVGATTEELAFAAGVERNQVEIAVRREIHRARRDGDADSTQEIAARVIEGLSRSQGVGEDSAA